MKLQSIDDPRLMQMLNTMALELGALARVSHPMPRGSARRELEAYES